MVKQNKELEKSYAKQNEKGKKFHNDLGLFATQAYLVPNQKS